ncbi:MAG: hypothetical protein LBK68_00505 [Candidatus Margulisbacteria bacterium]|jgi:hypothetical protein|nr:hypothetical protein [Candidatus Margulisiibacteriota bacterium]
MSHYLYTRIANSLPDKNIVWQKTTFITPPIEIQKSPTKKIDTLAQPITAGIPDITEQSRSSLHIIDYPTTTTTTPTELNQELSPDQQKAIEAYLDKSIPFAEKFPLIQQYCNDKNFIMTLIQKANNAPAYLLDLCREIMDEELLTLACSVNKGLKISAYATDELQNNLDFILPILEKNPDAFLHLGTKAQNNPQIILSTLIHWDYDNSFKSIFNVVEKLDFSTLLNKELLHELAANIENGGVVISQVLREAHKRAPQEFSSFLGSNPGFIPDLLATDRRLLVESLQILNLTNKNMHNPIRRFFGNIKTVLTFDAEKKQERQYARLIIEAIPQMLVKQWDKELEAIGIKNSALRFKNDAIAQHIIEQRAKLENKQIDSTKPVTVIFYAQADYNYALTQNSFAEMITHNNQVLFFSISSDQDLQKYLKLLTENLPQGKEITFIIGGHGTHNKTYFGTSGIYSGHTLDPSDYTKLGFKNAWHNLNAHNPIRFFCLEACSNGQGKENQATRLAKITGVNVYAATTETTGVNYDYTDTGEITNPHFRFDILHTGKTIIAGQ